MKGKAGESVRARESSPPANSLNRQFCHGVPEYILETCYPVVSDFDPFVFKELLHDMRPTEMMLSGQCAIPVNDTVSRDGLLVLVGAVHGPPDHAGRHAGAQVTGNGPVGGHASFRDQAHHVINPFEK